MEPIASEERRIKVLPIWQRELAKIWSADRARQLAQSIQARYAELRGEQLWPANRKLCWHLDEHILPTLALYQELRATDPVPEEALKVTAALIAASAEGPRRQYARLGRLPFFYTLLRLFIRTVMKRDYPAEGWAMEWIEVSDCRIAFNVHRCFYHDVFTKHGAPELTSLSCGYDDLMFEKMSPNVRWARTQTIGRGAPLCNFRYEQIRSSKSG